MGLCFALTFGSGRTQTDLEQSSVLLCADCEHIEVLRMLLNTLSLPLLSCLRVPAQRFLVEAAENPLPIGVTSPGALWLCSRRLMARFQFLGRDPLPGKES